MHYSLNKTCLVIVIFKNKNIQVFVLALKRTGHIPTAICRVFSCNILIQAFGLYEVGLISLVIASVPVCHERPCISCY